MVKDQPVVAVDRVPYVGDVVAAVAPAIGNAVASALGGMRNLPLRPDRIVVAAAG